CVRHDQGYAMDYW
nr:immunoglobulin heavy chain junction region [Mus musculus]MBK4190041.1 immunoglobulin heavy chain junction region [Mus musculus]